MRRPHHPLDRVFLELLIPAALVSPANRAHWTVDGHAVALRHQLNDAAETAENTFHARAAAFEQAASRQAREADRRLAGIIKSRSELITTAASADVYVKMHEWLAGGIRKWLANDLDGAIRNAPDLDRRRPTQHQLTPLSPRLRQPRRARARSAILTIAARQMVSTHQEQAPSPARSTPSSDYEHHSPGCSLERFADPLRRQFNFGTWRGIASAWLSSCGKQVHTACPRFQRR